LVFDLCLLCFRLLSQETKQHQDSFKALFLEEKQHQAVQSELAKQQAKMHDRAVFLERLEGCISEGPANAALIVREKELQEKDDNLTKQLNEIDRLHQEAALKEASFVARQENLHRISSSLEAKVTQEAGARKNIASTATLLKSRADALSLLQKDIMKRSAALDGREEDLKRREADIASRLAEVDGQVARFAEVRSEQRELFFESNVQACGASTDCKSCIRSAKCGWCASSTDGSTGSCMTHDVNAAADGLTSGECPMKNWFSKVSDRVTALNLNVFGGDDADADQRSAALFNVIIAAKYPDFVALQEVNEWFLTRLFEQKWFQQYYHITRFAPSSINGNNAAPGGLAILSRFEIKRVAYADQQRPSFAAIDERPRLLTAEVEFNGKTIVVGSAMLDWRSAGTRAEGLHFIDGLTNTLDNFLLLGDFNFDEGAKPETQNIPASWTDLWLKLHKDEKPEAVTRGPNRYGYTWDPATNWYARYSDSTSQPTRVDRIFYRSTVMKPREIVIVGCPGPDYLCEAAPKRGDEDDRMIPYQPASSNSVAGNVIYPSSHYGLLATFSTFVPYC
jgi:endonuclease/exonuclease/phosphatase family metal-dependent hydrolase